MILFTVQSFVEMTKLLLSKHPHLYVLSERFSQDPLENYFGKQRQRGGRNENPNLQQCLVNAASLRIQGSPALDPVRGNCRKRPRDVLDEKKVISECVPLPKRPSIRAQTK